MRVSYAINVLCLFRIMSTILCYIGHFYSACKAVCTDLPALHTEQPLVQAYDTHTHTHKCIEVKDFHHIHHFNPCLNALRLQLDLDKVISMTSAQEMTATKFFCSNATITIHSACEHQGCNDSQHP